MSMRSAPVARNSHNTIRLPNLRGFIRSRFLSSHGYPIVGPEFKLSGGDRAEWPDGEEVGPGTVLWRRQPIGEDYEVTLKLAGREVLSAVPWLAESVETHEQHIWNARELLGEPDDAHGLQVCLNGLGFPCGAVDGVVGRKTRDALDAFARARCFEAVEDEQRLGELLAIEFCA